jgi:hypothetical protein
MGGPMGLAKPSEPSSQRGHAAPRWQTRARTGARLGRLPDPDLLRHIQVGVGQEQERRWCPMSSRDSSQRWKLAEYVVRIIEMIVEILDRSGWSL